MTKFSRKTAVAVAAMFALAASAFTTAPAFAATPITWFEVSDGTTTGEEVTFANGSNVTVNFNGLASGDYTLTGCYVVEIDGTPAASNPATQATYNWASGTSIDTIFTAVNLTPTTKVTYDILLYSQLADAETATCAEVTDSEKFKRSGWVTMKINAPVDPFTMTLTGDPRVGSTVTVQSKVAGSLVGNDFDLWACPDTSVLPRADAANPADNGLCVGPYIQTRTGDSTSFFLGYDAARDANNVDAKDFWQATCDAYFVVNDYPGGGHSNWIGPINCDSTAAATTSNLLAATGSALPSIALGAVSLLTISLGAFLVTRRARRS